MQASDFGRCSMGIGQRLALKHERRADLCDVGSVGGLLRATLVAELERVNLQAERGLYAWAEGLGVAERDETVAVDLGLCTSAGRENTSALGAILEKCEGEHALMKAAASR